MADHTPEGEQDTIVVTMPVTLKVSDPVIVGETRATLSAADINDLPDSAFAYIEDGGKKDSEGKTTPRSLRHYPIQDKAHADNAAARAAAALAGDDADAKAIAGKAMPKIKAAQAKFNGQSNSSEPEDEQRVPKRTPRRKARHRAVPLMPEVRHWAASGLELRSSADSDTITITGEPIVYNTDYQVRDLFGEFTERMTTGVAANVLADGVDCRFLFNHDGLPLARTVSGTLVLEDTPTALRFSARLDARQQLANDLAVAVERGDISQMSCGFIVAEDNWDERMEDRTILRLADLLDVSAVTYPASPTTSIDVARRMAMEIPVESRARARKLYADLRAGKMLSQANQDKIVEAASALHQILDNSGFDPQQLIEDSSPVDDDEAVGVESDDASDPSYADGSGVRSDDPGEPIRAAKLATLRVQMNARKLRRAA